MGVFEGKTGNVESYGLVVPFRGALSVVCGVGGCKLSLLVPPSSLPTETRPHVYYHK